MRLQQLQSNVGLSVCVCMSACMYVSALAPVQRLAIKNARQRKQAAATSNALAGHHVD